MVEGPRGRKAASTDTAHDPRSCISFGDCRTYCWGKPDMSLLQHRTQPRILLGSGPPLPSLVPRGMFVPVLCWGSFFMAGPHPRRSCGTQSQALCGPTILLTPASCRPWAAIPLAAFPAFQVGRNHPASQDLHFCGPSSARFRGSGGGQRLSHEEAKKRCLPPLLPPRGPGCETNPEWTLKLSCQVISHSQRDCTASCSMPAGPSSWRGATEKSYLPKSEYHGID
ncbi:uncharacterized protein [Oryctolagus cuniculus]|uniref:uncharacterized protein isoform X1 n=1 Tax=Oryctolagus cuniculus TaxID=9986 RepID=UPI003879C04C